MAEHNPKARPQPAFLFDLDGTLIDSVYQHVLAGGRRSKQRIFIFRTGTFIGASA
jgi:phosphoglycolate phosphatase-like HAD superfamily hydrolase